MQIQYNNVTNKYSHRMSFSGQRLLRLNFEKLSPNKSKEILSGYFTKLDENDLSFMQKIKPAWDLSSIGKLIIYDFIEKYKAINNKITNLAADHPANADYFVLESSKSTNPYKQIKALAEIRRLNNILKLDYIQSINLAYMDEKINGAGTLLLYSLIKYAQKHKLKAIRVVSTCNSWYQHLGLKYDKIANEFELNAKDFPAFLKNVEKKYNINSKDSKIGKI